LGAIIFHGLRSFMNSQRDIQMFVRDKTRGIERIDNRKLLLKFSDLSFILYKNVQVK